jgi:hypothetical protein
MTFSHGESGIIWSPVVVLVLRLLCGIRWCTAKATIGLTKDDLHPVAN